MSHTLFINCLVYTLIISDVFDLLKTETVFVDSFKLALAFCVHGVSPGVANNAGTVRRPRGETDAIVPNDL